MIRHVRPRVRLHRIVAWGGRVGFGDVLALLKLIGAEYVHRAEDDAHDEHILIFQPQGKTPERPLFLTKSGAIVVHGNSPHGIDLFASVAEAMDVYEHSDVVSTESAVLALPVGSVVETSSGIVHTKMFGGGWFRSDGESSGVRQSTPPLPLTVIHRPPVTHTITEVSIP